MSIIQKLTASEIQKIAAGQVVDRPVDVAKELIENALDAGATKITLEVQQSGHKRIRVVDNGCGMSHEDARVCFERYATSKLTHFDQLQTLATFGFRGEALASIGAISNVLLRTKQAGAPYGYQVSCSQGRIVETSTISCDTGSDFCVDDLFINVPVRKKFLKQQETEWRSFLHLFQAVCFTFPTIHFQLIADTTMVHNCPPVHTVQDRCIQLWQQSCANNMISITHDATIQRGITGIISSPNLTRYNRNSVWFTVNNRWIKNYHLGQALVRGYLNVLPTGRYPVAVINITIDQADVDINVHPRKEEITFLHPKHIEHALTALVKKTLEHHVSHRFTVSSTLPLQPEPTWYNRSTAMPPSPFMEYANSNKQLLPSHGQTSAEPYEEPSQQNHTAQIHPETHSTQAIVTAPSSEKNTVITSAELPTIIGVYNKTYIMLEHDDGILFIDQHAAHERIMFERFNCTFNETPSIKLMFPEIIDLSTYDLEVLLNHTLLLTEYGLIIEQFGTNELIVQSVPIYLKHVELKALFQEIVALIAENNSAHDDNPCTKLTKKLQAHMACKAAVKAGDSLNEQHIAQLINDLTVIDNRFTCPHGRPTSWFLPLYDIEKKFKRKN